MHDNIVMLRLDDIIPYENNPRINDSAVDMVADSIANFGFKNPIIVDKDHVVIAGHTRLKAAYKLGLTQAPVIIADDLSEDDVKAYRLVDNRTSEVADWDFEKLKQELDTIELDMSGFDFSFEQLQTIDDTAQADDDNFDIDEALDNIDEPTAQLGDVWQLGKHRLMCGDSTSEDNVQQLLDGANVDLLLTDPPYNVNYEGTAGTIKNDNLANDEFVQFLRKAFENAYNVMRAGAAFYIWHADGGEGFNFRKSANDAGLQIRQFLMWVKNGFTFGRQDYQWRHEPCLYGWKEGAAHYFTDDRTQSTVFEDLPNINKMSKEELKAYIKELHQQGAASTVLREDKPLANIDHPTMKPVKLIGLLIKNSSKKQESVFDPFGGSGTTLVACEQLDRQCYTMELDPKYCDVIIKRWETLTGQQAVQVK